MRLVCVTQLLRDKQAIVVRERNVNKGTGFLIAERRCTHMSASADRAAELREFVSVTVFFSMSHTVSVYRRFDGAH